VCLASFLSAAESDFTVEPAAGLPAFDIQLMPEVNANAAPASLPNTFAGAAKIPGSYSFSATVYAQTARRRTGAHSVDWAWTGSQAALGVANLLDSTSSYGKQEANPVLSGAGGRFDLGSIILKVAMVGGFEATMTWGIHRHAAMRRFATIVNYSMAAGLGGVAVHNFTIPRPAQ
jgi:hypothetical protein